MMAQRHLLRSDLGRAVWILLLLSASTQVHTSSPLSTNSELSRPHNVDDMDELRQGMCQDRHGFLHVSKFHYRSCATCYMYLFPANRDLVAVPPYEQLIPRNVTAYGSGPITPDPTNEAAMEQVCATLHGDECRRWRDCCHSAVACCEQQRKTPFPNDRDVCLRTWDGYSCWSDTHAATKVSMSCPTFTEHSFQNRHAFKECTSKATWAQKQGLEWTDYRSCFGAEVHTSSSLSTNVEPNPLRNVDDVDDVRQSMCQDRHGYLQVSKFHYRSCAMCYMYLFLANRDLVAFPPYEQLIPRNLTAYGSGPITPDPTNETAMEQVCATLHGDECRRWRDCCHSAVACCEQQRKTPFPNDRDVCLRTWDGYSCWSDTHAATKVSMSCPTFMEHSFQNRHSLKECTSNATWVKKQGLEWTDYRPCVDIEGVLVNVYICVSCNSASILLLLPSIIIFFVFKDLCRQHRIRLHINFFLSLLFRSVAVILWFLMVHHEKLTNKEVNEAVMIRNPVWCRVLSFFKIYLNSATYTWMFCEGHYLHRLISRAFEPPKSLITLYTIGWGLPAIPAIIYSILRVVIKNDSCWVHNLGNLEWVLYAPNLLCLTLNIMFLCNILRILLFQLHSHPHEPSSFRRGLKAGFMLVPLFGIQLILTIYRPSASLAGNFKAYEYTTTIIIHSQGVFVALVFCFFNGEVLANFYDRCPCCQGCLKHCVKSRSGNGGHVTQVTFADDRRSPSIHSHSSVSPKRNGRYSVNGYKEAIDMQDLGNSGHNSINSLSKHNGGSPGKKVVYTPVPTEPVEPNTPP